MLDGLSDYDKQALDEFAALLPELPDRQVACMLGALLAEAMKRLGVPRTKLLLEKAVKQAQDIDRQRQC
jgi:hypothetical protein